MKLSVPSVILFGSIVSSLCQQENFFHEKAYLPNGNSNKGAHGKKSNASTTTHSAAPRRLKPSKSKKKSTKQSRSPSATPSISARPSISPMPSSSPSNAPSTVQEYILDVISEQQACIDLLKGEIENLAVTMEAQRIKHDADLETLKAEIDSENDLLQAEIEAQQSEEHDADLETLNAEITSENDLLQAEIEAQQSEQDKNLIF
jgi:hypothetical protein